MLFLHMLHDVVQLSMLPDIEALDLGMSSYPGFPGWRWQWYWWVGCDMPGPWPWEKQWQCHRVKGRFTCSRDSKELFLERCLDRRTEDNALH